MKSNYREATEGEITCVSCKFFLQCGPFLEGNHTCVSAQPIRMDLDQISRRLIGLNSHIADTNRQSLKLNTLFDELIELKEKL